MQTFLQIESSWLRTAMDVTHLLHEAEIEFESCGKAVKWAHCEAGKFNDCFLSYSSTTRNK